jgi:WD40 repeat protein
MLRMTAVVSMILAMAVGSASGGAAKPPQGQDYEKFVKVRELKDYPGEITCLEWLPDSKAIVIAGRTPELWLWYANSGDIFAKLNTESMLETCALDLSADGKILAAISRDGTVQIWGMREMRLLRTINTGVMSGSRYVDLSPDGMRFLCKDKDRADANIWDIAKGAITRKIEVYGFARWTADGTRVIDYGKSFVSIRDGNSGKILQQFKNEKLKTADLIFGPDDRTCVAGIVDDAIGRCIVSICDIAVGLPMKELFRAPVIVWPLEYSRDGKNLLLRSDDVLSVCNIATRTPTNILTVNTSTGGSITTARMSPDGRAVAVVDKKTVIILAENPGPQAEVK